VTKRFKEDISQAYGVDFAHMVDLDCKFLLVPKTWVRNLIFKRLMKSTINLLEGYQVPVNTGKKWERSIEY